MFRAEALGRMNSSALAVLCGELAATTSELDNEVRWQRLLKPEIRTAQETQLLETKRLAIRQRMIDLLISI